MTLKMRPCFDKRVDPLPENFDVVEVPEEMPNLLGHVPLEVLNFVLVLDSRGQNLVLNPAHGGEQMTQAYYG
jgi:hypothetical protein